MARLPAKDAAARLAEAHWEALVRVTERPPPGYTANTLVTEWMTLNCRSDWTSVSLGGGRVLVRWLSREDFEAARAHFVPNVPWKSRGSRAAAGFRFAS